MLVISGLDLGGKRGFAHRFAPGAITVVLGRNNSGKTRLARAIAGLEPSPPGTVAIDGIDVSGADARRRPVGLVYQAFVNYPDWNVFRNIASPLIAQGVEAEAASGTVRSKPKRHQARCANWPAVCTSMNCWTVCRTNCPAATGPPSAHR